LTAFGGSGTPPFRAAIAEYPAWQPFLNETSQELLLSNVFHLANCTTIDCLRTLSSARLQAVHLKSYLTGYGQPGYGYGVFYYAPIVDGNFIRELPDQAFKAGRFHDVPIIVDHDQLEGYVFVNASINSTSAETANTQILFPRAGSVFFTRLYQLYPYGLYNSTFVQQYTWFGDFLINCNQILELWH
jgi:carboxylesterase type B